MYDKWREIGEREGEREVGGELATIFITTGAHGRYAREKDWEIEADENHLKF